MTVARRVWLVAALVWLAVACGSLAAPARKPVDAARQAIGAAVALPATSNHLAEVKELRLARQAGRQYTERIAATALLLRAQIARFRAENGIPRGDTGSGLGGTVAAAEIQIDGMATWVSAAGSTRSQPQTATNEGARDRYQSEQEHGSTKNHAEQRLLSEIAEKIIQAQGLDSSSRAPKPSVTGRIQVLVEQEPCPACKSGLRNLAARSGIIKQFSQEFPNAQLVVTNNRQDEVDFVHNAARVRFKPTAARVPVYALPQADTASTGSAVDPDVGGVDFSSLELRYLSDASTDKTHATGFAFKASPAKGRRGGDGLRAAERASDAFFVWLALPTDAMWVNLNPTEPDSIVDPRLGSTNAGRVLLEADLRMKRLSARLTHPKTRLGRRYWSKLAGIPAEGARCSATRMWIVPARATVRETADELYIVKAPLRVRLQTDLSGTLRCNAGLRYAERVNDLDRRLILPRVQRAVRRAPEFAALRSVYMSRIAAEWYRERKQDGAFADIIDSGNVSAWAPSRSWTPQSAFRRYVRSFENGEYKVRQRVVRGGQLYTRTISAGGVDFGSVPRDKVDAQELATLRPGLAQRLSQAIARPAADPQLGEVWLAGTTFDRKAAVEDPELDEQLGGGGDDDAATGPLTIAMIAFVITVLLASFVGFVVRRRRRRWA
jgi:hypothetical protein